MSAMNYRPNVLDSIHEWDVFTFRKFASLPLNCPGIRIARHVSHTGNGYLYPLVLLLVLILDPEGSSRFVKLVILAFGIERIMYLFAKNSFRRRRPANILPDYHSIIIASDEFSFPSGHSSAAFLMVTMLVLAFGPICAPLFLWAAMVAASRVLLGVHFPTDIFVGSLMGSSIAWTCFSLLP